MQVGAVVQIPRMGAQQPVAQRKWGMLFAYYATEAVGRQSSVVSVEA